MLEGLKRAGHHLLAITSTWTDEQFNRRLAMLAVPEIAVADDETGNRFWQGHGRLFQLSVKMRVFARHLRLAHGFDPFLR